MAQSQTAEKDEQATEDTGQGSQDSHRTAVKAAAAAAATAAAAVAAKKALSGRHSSNGQSGNGNGARSSGDRSQGSMMSSMLSGGWDAARDALLPAAEDAAAALGEYAAKNAPEIVRDRIVPRFIEAFNDQRGS